MQNTLDLTAIFAKNKALYGDIVMSTPTGEPAQQAVSDTAGGGVLVGADPRTPAPTFSIVNPVAGQNTTLTNPAAIFTAEQIQKARQEEKDKLYPQLETMREQLNELTKARDEKIESETKARKAAEKLADDARKADTNTRDLLEQQKAEFDAKLAELQTQREQEQAMQAMERSFQELQTYKEQALTANFENIIPQLATEVRETNHSSREDIDKHIARLAATSASIMQEVQQAQQAARAGMRGGSVTAPPTGPLDTYSGNDSVMEAAHNGTLSFDDYVKNRDKLMSSVSQSGGLYGR